MARTDTRVESATETESESATGERRAESLVEQSVRRRILDLAEPRLARQIDFLIEIDRLKTILRRTLLTDGSRHENSAEHSWHLALLALVLAEWSNEPIDTVQVVKMLLVHDIVEIDAGDTFCYDEQANLDKDEREQRAAVRIFGKLPEEQASELRELWDEFELRRSPEARFANAIDRLQPMLHNVLTRGHSWREHGVPRRRVVARNQPIEQGSEALWAFARQFLDVAEVEGWFPSDESPASSD